MNELEIALLGNNEDLDCYLEMVKTDNLRKHIEEIRKKAAVSTSAGKLREKIMEVLSGVE